MVDGRCYKEIIRGKLSKRASLIVLLYIQMKCRQVFAVYTGASLGSVNVWKVNCSSSSFDVLQLILTNESISNIIFMIAIDQSLGFRVRSPKLFLPISSSWVEIGLDTESHLLKVWEGWGFKTKLSINS
jgi:hypothetical protein